MATRQEHAKQAENCLRMSSEASLEDGHAQLLATHALVHATLATVVDKAPAAVRPLSVVVADDDQTMANTMRALAELADDLAPAYAIRLYGGDIQAQGDAGAFEGLVKRWGAELLPDDSTAFTNWMTYRATAVGSVKVTLVEPKGEDR